VDPGVRIAGGAGPAARRGALPRAAGASGLGHRLRGALERRRRVREGVAGPDRPSLRSAVAADREGDRLPADGGPGVRTLPLRLRLALAFAGAAAILLTAVGVFGYVRLSAGFSDDVDLELRQRAQDLVGPVSRPEASLGDLSASP